jgi:hypothetical protein
VCGFFILLSVNYPMVSKLESKYSPINGIDRVELLRAKKFAIHYIMSFGITASSAEVVFDRAVRGLKSKGGRNWSETKVASKVLSDLVGGRIKFTKPSAKVRSVPRTKLRRP